MTEEQDEQAAAERAKRRRRQKRIDRILIYGGAAATITLIAWVLLIGDYAQEAASPTSTVPTSMTTTMPIPDPSTTPPSTPPESGAVVHFGVEPPDFDQIAKTDGGIEACRAWAEWNNSYNETVSCEIGGGEYRVSEVDVDCPVRAALLDMADCVTVGWANLDTYLQCVDGARETTTTSTEAGSQVIHRAYFLSAEDRARCRTATTTDSE
jgi:hypothetical protein